MDIAKMIFATLILVSLCTCAQFTLLVLMVLHMRRNWVEWRHFANIVHGYADAVRDFRENQVVIAAQGINQDGKPVSTGPRGMPIRKT